jgi:hypothetical protein
MLSDRHPRAAWDYLKNGPRQDDLSMVATFIGMMIWWRTWAFAFFWATLSLATMRAVEMYGPITAPWILAGGILLGQRFEGWLD